MQILHPPSVQFKLYQGEVFQYKPGASDHRSVLLRVSCRPGALGGAMSAPAGGAAASAATGAAAPPTDREVVALLRERVPKFRDLPPQQRLLSADLKLELQRAQRHRGGAACLPTLPAQGAGWPRALDLRRPDRCTVRISAGLTALPPTAAAVPREREGVPSHPPALAGRTGDCSTPASDASAIRPRPPTPAPARPLPTLPRCVPE